MDNFTDPFFYGGIAAALFILLTCLLVGLSLFQTGAAQAGYLRKQSFALFLQLSLLLWLSATLWGQIEPMRHLPEPQEPELQVWFRRAMSVLLVGISTVFASLLATFGWVRTGKVGNAMRSVVWSILGVKIVIASVVVLGLLEQAHLGPGEEGAIAHGDLPGVSEEILQPLESIATVWLPGCVAFLVISVVISIGKRRAPAGFSK
ncbi:MAG: hypothetical protein QF489_09790 [Planctomycetota bacterium]|nr:hypothetical protein [Planctomycetota bacterium]